MKKKGLTRRAFLERTAAGMAVASMAPRRAPAVSGNPNTLALVGGTPVRSKPYPEWPQTTAVDEANILQSLRSHRWCTLDQGNFIPQFEKAWGEKIGAGGCVMTPCGTHALHMAIEILGIGPGDEVLVTPYTWIATLQAIMLSYALPVFVDTDPKTFMMDPAKIEPRITEHTRAILPVHIYSNASHLDEILRIAQRHNLPVIEDACQGHLVEWKGKKVGTFGTIGCFSFQESKIIPGGEAGALVSNDPALIDKAYSFRDFGKNLKPHTSEEMFVIRAHKYRISDFAASVLMAQLTRLDEVSAVREKHAAYLTEEINRIPGLRTQENYPECNRRTYYEFGMRFNSEHFSGMRKSKFVQAMRAEGIPIDGGYPRMNKQPFIEASLNSRGFRTVFSPQRLAKYRAENHCPNNDQLCDTVLSVGQQVLIGTKEDVSDILEAAAKVQKYAATVS